MGWGWGMGVGKREREKTTMKLPHRVHVLENGLPSAAQKKNGLTVPHETGLRTATGNSGSCQI